MSKNPAERRTRSAEDEARIQQYVEGNGATFNELDGWIRVELRARYPGLRDDHEDLAQVIHSRLLILLREDRFKGRSALRSYVIGISHHVAIDRTRQMRRQRQLIESVRAEPTAWTHRWRGDDERPDSGLLHAAIQAVPESCRQLWGLIFLDNLDYVEIGQRLSVPVGTVKSRAFHCRRKAMLALDRLRRSRQGS